MPAIRVYSLDLFLWHKKSRTLTTEASMLGKGNPPAKLRVRSHRTKTTKDFYFVRAERDNENDVLAWHYHDADSDIKVAVFND